MTDAGVARGNPLAQVGSPHWVTNALDAIQHAVIVTDALGRVIFWSHHAEALYGWSASEALGQAIQDLTVPLLQAEDAGAIIEHLSSGQVWIGEFSVQRRDGSTFTATVRDVPVLDDAGQLVAIVGISNDVSDQQRDQRALRESELRFKALTMTAPSAVWMSDRSGQLSFVNSTWEAYTGRTLEDSRDFSWQQVIHPEDWPLVVERWTRANASGEQFESLHRIRDANGSYRWHLARANPIMDASGSVAHWIGANTDVHDQKRAEALLERYRLLTEWTRDLILLMRLDGRIVEANVAAVAAYGYERDVLLTMSVRDLRAPDTVALMSEQMDKANREGILFETRHRRSDGSLFPVEVSSVGADVDGERMLLSVIRDISLRKQAQDALEANERLLERALVAGGMFAFSYDLTADRIERSETGAMVLRHERPREDSGSGYYGAIHPEDRPRVTALIQGLSAAEPTYSTVYRYLSARGQIIWLEESGTAELDAHGVVIRIRGLTANVTERKQAEEDREQLLARSQSAEAHYRSLFEEAGEAILVADAGGYFQDVNPAASQLLGYQPEDLQQRNFLSIVANRERASAAFAQLQATGSWQGDIDLIRLDGSPVPVDVTATRVITPFGVVYRAGLRDLSESRRLERMQREFVALAAHELKTPLTSLKGFVQLLQRGVQSPRAMSTIVSQVNRLDRLVNDLLEVSRLDTGHFDLRRGRVDLVSIAQRCVEEARATTTDHTIRLSSSSPVIEGDWDEDRIAQIMQNLLSNAIKYSPNGGEVLVSMHADSTVVSVSIQDHGLGIHPADVPNIFERFHRVETSKEVASGMGLGLSITRSYVEAHGGQIQAASDGPGRGSSFTFSLPL